MTHSIGRPIACLLAFLVIFATGCGKEEAPRSFGTPKVKAAIPLVKKTVLWDEYTGRMAPTDFVEVRARVSGYLESIHFQEGQMVEADDLLFVIDQRPFRAALKASKARETESQARLSQAKSTLAAAQAAKKQSEARFDLAESNFERAQALVRGNAISREELDVRKSELLQAEADIESANAEIEASRAGIATAEAAIATANAEVEASELELQYTQITAPISGRIGQELITEGNLILGGAGGEANVLTTIVALDPIYCQINANEQAFVKYQQLEQSGTRGSSRSTKNPVLLQMIGEDGFPHSGHMDFVDNRLDRNTGTIQGRAIFANPDSRLTPGQFGRVMIPGSGIMNVILIPDTAIMADQSKRFVYKLSEDNQTIRTEITPGEMIDGLREIRDGITVDDKIVLTNLQILRPDTQVEVEMVSVEPSEDDGLPDDYEVVPESDWLSKQPRKQPDNFFVPESEPTTSQETTPTTNVGGQQ